MFLVKKKQPSFLKNALKQSKIVIWNFGGVAKWIFPGKSHPYKMKCQTDTFHEVLQGNLVFFHFYYSGTKEITYLNQKIEFSIKN